MLEGRAIDLLRNGVFPEWWAFVPVAGKATYVTGWSSRPLSREELVETYKSNTSYHGLGVCTGEFSGGLIALDVDGLQADERYRAIAGTEYEEPEDPGTMSWTSGKPGRRQLLYRVPAAIVPELRHLYTLILRENGEWHLGTGDKNRSEKKEEEGAAQPAGAYEEVVLRFNACQSVVPGSPHPGTKKPYRWINYNGGEVAMAPEWVMDLLRDHRKPVQWLSDADQKALDAELGETAVPSRQIRGWFFKDEVQALLQPRLEELIFKHPVFDKYGWRERNGSKPQRMSGCPWHGGQSGTSFQYATESGCWDCKACGTGGDVLDFLHRVERNDPYAERPQGPDLERHVARVATALGYDYPACANVVEVTTKEVPVRRLTGAEFFAAAQKLDEEFENAELGDYHLMELVRDAGLLNVYRSGPQVRAALERFMMHEEQVEEDEAWQEKCRGKRDYLIPDFVSRPSSIMLHARGGMGKTRLAILLARIVGQKLPMKVRGITVEPTTTGNVLFIGNDMSMTDYAEYLDQQGIDSAGADKWFRFKPHWQQSQYRVLVRWLEELKPVLVVVDSLTSVSTMIAAKEYEKEYANTLYRLARENGTAFPATTFLWVHHNTKDGTKFRGSDALRNAVHETWELKELSDEERVQFGDRSMILEIDKSRGMRGGDRFLIREDIEEALSIEDLTPTVKRENGGQGDETPRTLVLGVLRDAERPLTRKELRFELNTRLAGRRGGETFVSDRSVHRWLQAWQAAGLVGAAAVRREGQGKGRSELAYEVLSPIYQANSDIKSSFFAESSSAAGDLKNDTGFGIKCPEGGGVIKSELVADGTVETEDDTGVPPENEVTQVLPAAPPEDEAALNDTPPGQSPVSFNPEPETQSSAGFFENGAGFNDTEPQVKGDLPRKPDEGTWDDVRWG